MSELPRLPRRFLPFVVKTVHQMMMDNDGFREALRDLLHERLQVPVTEACPVACLGLLSRSFNALTRKHGTAMTVGELLAETRNGLGIGGLGKRSVSDVKDQLNLHGFSVELTAGRDV